MDEKKIKKLIFRFELFYLLGLGVSLAVSCHEAKENNPQAILEELSDEGASLAVYDETRGSGQIVSISADDSSEKRAFDEQSLKKLNQLINNEYLDVDVLTIEGLSSEVDFSKLELPDVDRVSFISMGDDFDYQGLDEWAFSNIDFFQVSMSDNLKKFLNDATLDYADISIWYDELDVLKYLGSIDKEVRAVTVSSFVYSDEISKTLEKVKARKIVINLDYNDDSKPFDLNLNLNDSVEEVVLNFDSFVDFQNIRLGNISIHGNNANLSVEVSASPDYCKVIMDDKTKFDFPDRTLVTFENVTCENAAAFNSLANVDGLDYSNGEGKKASFTDETSQNRKVKYR